MELIDCSTCPYDSEKGCPGLGPVTRPQDFQVPGKECWMLAKPQKDTQHIQHQKEMKTHLGENLDKFLERQHANWNESEKSEQPQQIELFE